jgi:hypothetical protein
VSRFWIQFDCRDGENSSCNQYEMEETRLELALTKVRKTFKAAHLSED